MGLNMLDMADGRISLRDGESVRCFQHLCHQFEDFHGSLLIICVSISGLKVLQLMVEGGAVLQGQMLKEGLCEDSRYPDHGHDSGVELV